MLLLYNRNSSHLKCCNQLRNLVLKTDMASLLLGRGLKIPSTLFSSKRCHSLKSIKWFFIVPQLDTCPKLMAFWGVILNRVQSFFSSQIDLNFRHISNYGTIVVIIENQGGKTSPTMSVTLVLGTFFLASC